LAIWRGPGGSGDATGDSANQAQVAETFSIQAGNSAAAAAASATTASNAATAASAAQTAAEAAQLAAETAETNAETAETNAETAQTAAEAAQLAAEAAQTAAELAETNAETAETNAEAAQTAAEAAQLAAENAQTAAELAETNAETAETNAASSASAAASSASAALTSETNAATSESNAASSASAAAGSASAAATSETNAASSASAASTSASNAATSESNAATSESNAATSASNASTSASNAATSETNAANSATAASNSASAAATSESNAAASAAAAATALDNFDDRYLGSKTSDPTVDNDGDPLVVGALYYNSVEGAMKVYDGSQWIEASAATQAILVVYSYTATAGQTTFTGSDDNSLTLSYTPGSAIITLNGVVQEVGTDVTATSGTSVVLATGAALNDELNVYAFSTFDVANTYTQAQADAAFVAKTGDTMTGGLTVPSLTASGNLTFTGTGNRITGDFTNATVANRVMFQSSTANGQTALSLLPNGTSTQSQVLAYSGTDPENSNVAQTLNNGTEVSFRSAAIGTGSYLPMTFYNGGSERMRIDTSGNVGIGTTTVRAQEHIFGNGQTTAALTDAGNRGGMLRVSDNSNSAGAGGAILFSSNQGDGANSVGFAAIKGLLTNGSDNTQGDLAFSTRNTTNATSLTERMRINANGPIGMGMSGVGTVRLAVASESAFIMVGRNSAGTIDQFRIFANGDAANTNNVYGSISDVKLKENIVDATPKLEQLNQVRVVNYNLKTDPEKKLIGVVAQELEEVFPGLVDEILDQDAAGNYLDTTTKTVKYSVFVPMLIKAIQELKAELDTVKAELATLKGQA
jgi:hypothetical protein